MEDISRRRHRRPFAESCGANVDPTPISIRTNSKSRNSTPPRRYGKCKGTVRHMEDQVPQPHPCGVEVMTGDELGEPDIPTCLVTGGNLEQVVKSRTPQDVEIPEQRPQPCTQYDAQVKFRRWRNLHQKGKLDLASPYVPLFKAGTLANDRASSASIVDGPIARGPEPAQPYANPRRWKCGVCLTTNGPGLNPRGGRGVCSVCHSERPRGLARTEDLPTALWAARRATRMTFSAVSVDRGKGEVSSFPAGGTSTAKPGGETVESGDDAAERCRCRQAASIAQEASCAGSESNKSWGFLRVMRKFFPSKTSGPRKQMSIGNAPESETGRHPPTKKTAEVTRIAGRSKQVSGTESSPSCSVASDLRTVRKERMFNSPGLCSVEDVDDRCAKIKMPPAVEELPGFGDRPLCFEENGTWHFMSPLLPT